VNKEEGQSRKRDSRIQDQQNPLVIELEFELWKKVHLITSLLYIAHLGANPE
jgi:hypothetical protein